MPAPFSRQFLPVNTPETRLQREIDTHYHAEMTARNTGDFVSYQRELLQSQHEAAVTNLRAMGEIAQRQDQTNGLLCNLMGGMDRLGQGMDSLQATATDTLDAVYAQTEMLESGFHQIAERMEQQRKTLAKIADALRKPYETQVQELLKHADRALNAGMTATGRERQAEYKDALHLLDEVLKNPVGSRNYVAWFQTGWLRWQHLSDLREAEEAFFNAQRLSRETADLYHVRGLRHMAYVQYLQGNNQDAYSTMLKALDVSRDDPDVLYDAARYAATVGQTDQALSLLDQCIDLRPQTIITMFSEEDFLR